MNKYEFIKSLLPTWIAEIILTSMYHTFGTDKVISLSTILMIVSVVFFPFIAGLRVVRSNGSIGLAALGGISISGATLLSVSISYIITSSGFMTFGGVIIATLLYSLLPQAIFSSVGGMAARHIYAKTT